MKIKIIRSHEDYAPIRSLLQVAIENKDANSVEFIKIVVRDAQRLVRNEDSRYTVDRRLYVFSSELSRLERSRLEAMNPDRLTLNNLRMMLKFFG